MAARTSGIWDDIQRQYEQGNAIIRLIILNIAIFIISGLLLVPAYLFLDKGIEESSHFIEDWLYLPSNLSKLMFRPWTFVSYMFLHSGVWHLLFNMLLLFWFGRMVNDLLPDRKAFSAYVLGGLAGGLFFVLAYNVFPAFDGIKPPIVGASAGVMAIVTAAAALMPEARMQLILIGPVRVKYIVAVLILFDIIQIPGSNSGGHLAHLGGAAMGWFYIRQLQSGRDLAAPFWAFLALFQRKRMPKKTKPAPKRETKMVFRQSAPRKEKQQSEYSGYSRSFIQEYKDLSQQECIDAILDKIRVSGYSSLSEDEKSFLDKSSQG